VNYNWTPLTPEQRKIFLDLIDRPQNYKWERHGPKKLTVRAVSDRLPKNVYYNLLSAVDENVAEHIAEIHNEWLVAKRIGEARTI